jgi:hypothetical protein
MQLKAALAELLPWYEHRPYVRDWEHQIHETRAQIVFLVPILLIPRYPEGTFAIFIFRYLKMYTCHYNLGIHSLTLS